MAYPVLAVSRSVASDRKIPSEGTCAKVAAGNLLRVASMLF